MSAAVTTVFDRRSIVSAVARLRTPAGQADPHPLYARLRGLGDVVPAPWSGHLAVSYDVCNEVLRSKDWHVPDHGWRTSQGADAVRWNRPAVRSLSRTLSGLNPPEHTRQRRALGNIFDRGTLARLQRPVERIVHRLLDDLRRQLRDSGTADFVHQVSEQLPVQTLGHWLGIPDADRSLVRRLTHDHAHAGELLPTKSQLEISDRASLELQEYFRSLVRERRSRPGSDALSGWIRAFEEKQVEPDRERADHTLYHLAMFIAMAALETTSTTLSTMVWLLDQNPGQRRLLQANPELVPNAVEEVVRYDPPIHVISRIAAQDAQLADQRVARNEVVHVLVGAAHHDQERFSDPSTFDIQRTGPHLGFGGGMHYCIGAALARLQAQVLLKALLRRFYPHLHVTELPTWASRVVFRRLTSMTVTT